MNIPIVYQYKDVYSLLFAEVKLITDAKIYMTIPKFEVHDSITPGYNKVFMRTGNYIGEEIDEKNNIYSIHYRLSPNTLKAIEAIFEKERLIK